jgi:hypothetical protein
MPLTGMTLNQVLWQLPAAIAYQLQFVWMQMQGHQFVIGRRNEEWIFEQLKARSNGRRHS